MASQMQSGKREDNEQGKRGGKKRGGVCTKFFTRYKYYAAQQFAKLLRPLNYSPTTLIVDLALLGHPFY